MCKYREIEDIYAFVQELFQNHAQTIIGEKVSRIAARPGVPGRESIISWTVDAAGKPLMEKETIVSVDSSGVSDWVATKIDDTNKEIVDANGHINQWVITDTVFRKKYEPVPGLPGIYKPVGGQQKFLRLNEGISIVQWGEQWNVDQGGYINITNPKDMYVISARDFEDTYRIV